MKKEIGGYFELGLPDHGDSFEWAVKVQSGRAALRHLLENSNITLVYVPRYTCSAVTDAISDSQISIKYYHLTEDLYPLNLPKDLKPGSAILYINYFGLCDGNVERLNKKHLQSQLIIDNSQSLFSQPKSNLGTIYSLRKFMGVPDGGLLHSSQPIETPLIEDSDSFQRMPPLLYRLSSTAKEGFSSYQATEDTFHCSKPKKMSSLTKRILNSCDMEFIKNKRLDNFKYLTERLGNINTIKWEINTATAPLCYPLVLDKDTKLIRNQLIKQNVFVPAYWPGIDGVLNITEDRLTHKSLFLPCDQRYGKQEMNHISDIVESLL